MTTIFPPLLSVSCRSHAIAMEHDMHVASRQMLGLPAFMHECTWGMATHWAARSVPDIGSCDSLISTPHPYLSAGIPALGEFGQQDSDRSTCALTESMQTSARHHKNTLTWQAHVGL